MRQKPLAWILLVEDEEILSAGMSELLRANGYECVLADSAQTAWQRLQHTQFDAIVTDFRLRNGTAAPLLKRLQAVAQAPPVVLVTASADELDAELKTMQNCKLLEKPVRPEALLRALAACCQPAKGIHQRPRFISNAERQALLLDHWLPSLLPGSSGVPS